MGWRGRSACVGDGEVRLRRGETAAEQKGARVITGVSTTWREVWIVYVGAGCGRLGRRSQRAVVQCGRRGRACGYV